jgi:phage gp46-like protein
MDIALALGPNQDSSDIYLQNGDLALDGTLFTPVLLSLLCNRLADADDVIPDGSGNRRGWWYDAYAPALPDGRKNLSGSKLWLRVRCLATQQNLLQIVTDVEESLEWMVLTGVATDVAVSGAWVGDSGCLITVVIARQNAAGVPYNSTYELIWDRTLGNFSSTGGQPLGAGLKATIPSALGLRPGFGSNLGVNVPPAGIVYSDGVSLGAATIGFGLSWMQWLGTLAVGVVGWAALPEELQGVPIRLSVLGQPVGGTRILFSLPQGYTIPANFAGTTVIADDAASAAAVVSLHTIRAGVETDLGTVTFLPAGGTACTLSTQAAFITQANDGLVFILPEDATLAGFSIALLLLRI